ncbi:MAG: hydantoinase B/oxoprolinase family protein [Acidimicrobiales bacterium]|nr:hydantoinase B/oxoprolinase family protein [Acidimicrobiales bacterium]
MTTSGRAASGRATVDAFTGEVIRAGLMAITAEMKTNLMRTAYNPIIYEAEDFTVGLFDREGSTLSIGLGLPMFIRGLADCVKAKIDHWGLGGIEPGDVLLTNDPDVTGSHLNHLIFTAPVFNDDKLMGFASSMAHWADVGGVLGGVTQDIFSEGLQIPFVKVFKAGIEDQELTALIRMNCRSPERASGDMRAQLAAIWTGARRLSAMLARYGNAAFDASVGSMFEASEAQARAAVAAIPDGVYRAESFMDDDGVTEGRHLPIVVLVTVAGEQLTIDLSGCSPQVAGYFNSGPTAGRSAAEVAFKCLTTPTLYPINEGAFRPLRIVLPTGRIISATKPAAMRWWMTAPMTVVDTMFKALAGACPERVMAGHHADLNSSGAFAVIDPGTGRAESSLGGTGLCGGGFGAKYDDDGVSATVCLNDGDTHNSPVEATEAKAPLVVVRRALRQDSGGPGRFRGGLGVEQAVETLVPAIYSAQVERTQCPPWGLLGAGAGLANAVALQRAGAGAEEHFASGKVAPRRLAEGDRWITRTGGGGGFGDPFERDPELVLGDVRAGYVSREAALADYGVCVNTDVDPPQLDVGATEAVRRARAPGAQAPSGAEPPATS